MKKSWMFILLVVLVSCTTSHKFSSLGREYDIALFADEGLYFGYSGIIDRELAYPVVFTHTEPVFKVQPRKIEDFVNFSKQKNIVMIDDLSTPDPVTVFVKEALGEKIPDAVSTITVAHQKDIWIEGQSVIFILLNGASQEKDKLAASIREAHDTLYEYISERIEAGVAGERMKKAFSKSVEERIGLKVKIPARYNLYKTGDDFISFVTRVPDRLIFITQKDYEKNSISREELIELRNSCTAEHYDGDSVFYEYYKWAREAPEVNYYQGYGVEDFSGAFVYKLYGLWENNENLNGGPFVTYAVIQEGKITLFDAMLFSPKGPKWPYMNKLDALMKLNVKYMLEQTGE